jgi:UDP-N-acetylglucosamine 2-epimerase (non-hydrolysing)
LKRNGIAHLDTSKQTLPIKINTDLLTDIFSKAKTDNSPILSVVIGTKPDFYKQAPLVVEAKREKLPVFVIDTGQHFDDILGFGIKEFKLEESVGCDLQIRGDLMEKASDLITKF